jgi:hypothetical protein
MQPLAQIGQQRRRRRGRRLLAAHKTTMKPSRCHFVRRPADRRIQRIKRRRAFGEVATRKRRPSASTSASDCRGARAIRSRTARRGAERRARAALSSHPAKPAKGRLWVSLTPFLLPASSPLPLLRHFFHPIPRLPSGQPGHAHRNCVSITSNSLHASCTSPEAREHRRRVPIRTRSVGSAQAPADCARENSAPAPRHPVPPAAAPPGSDPALCPSALDGAKAPAPVRSRPVVRGCASAVPILLLARRRRKWMCGGHLLKKAGSRSDQKREHYLDWKALMKWRAARCPGFAARYRQVASLLH